jgi:hypothetical protein
MCGSAEHFRTSSGGAAKKSPENLQKDFFSRQPSVLALDFAWGI